MITTRDGGVSAGPWASLNLGDHVGDDPAHVSANRARLRQTLPAEPVWLRQVHGTRCVDVDRDAAREADAAVTRTPGTVLAILTADCLPVLLSDAAGTVVGAAHAGWRGLAAGVLESTVQSMALPAAQIRACFGPAIGPAAFEVGDEVRAAFLAKDPQAVVAFRPGAPGKWWCDLYELAAQRLVALGVPRPAAVDFCTVRDADRFFSYRRDGVSGRMASLIWLD